MAIIGNPRSFHKKFKFIVEIDDIGHAGFQKCSELSAEVASVQYFEGGSLIPNKSPGRLTFADVTLERGATEDHDLFDWFEDVAVTSSGLGLQDVARCHSCLGRIAVASGHLPDAERHLGAAEPVFRGSQMALELAWLRLHKANLAKARREWKDAISFSTNAVHSARVRESRILHADALVARGSVHYAQAAESSEWNDDVERLLRAAQDDAEAALFVAKACGYVWAERDALTLQADVLERQGRLDDASRCRERGCLASEQLRIDRADL